jgi:hypothetical protein
MTQLDEITTNNNTLEMHAATLLEGLLPNEFIHYNLWYSKVYPSHGITPNYWRIAWRRSYTLYYKIGIFIKAKLDKYFLSNTQWTKQIFNTPKYSSILSNFCTLARITHAFIIKNEFSGEPDNELHLLNLINNINMSIGNAILRTTQSEIKQGISPAITISSKIRTYSVQKYSDTRTLTESTPVHDSVARMLDKLHHYRNWVISLMRAKILALAGTKFTINYVTYITQRPIDILLSSGSMNIVFFAGKENPGSVFMFATIKQDIFIPEVVVELTRPDTIFTELYNTLQKEMVDYLDHTIYPDLF